MVDLLFRLVEKCMDLVRERQSNNRRLFEDFAEPAIADFEAVHANYLDTFRGYRQSITESQAAPDESHPILAKVREDMLFSHQLRSKLDALDALKSDPTFGVLIGRILAYTRGSEGAKQALLEGRRLYNAPRSSLIVGLQETFSGEASAATKRKEAVKVLDRIVEDLQWQHGQVLAEFAKVKANLLDARIKT